jgi:hypothetical protein
MVFVGGVRRVPVPPAASSIPSAFTALVLFSIDTLVSADSNWSATLEALRAQPSFKRSLVAPVDSARSEPVTEQKKGKPKGRKRKEQWGRQK